MAFLVMDFRFYSGLGRGKAIPLFYVLSLECLLKNKNISLARHMRAVINKYINKHELLRTVKYSESFQGFTDSCSIGKSIKDVTVVVIHQCSVCCTALL